MIGGMVVEVSEIKGNPEILFVDIQSMVNDYPTCSILVEKNKTSLKIFIGDRIWWKGRYAYWTPQKHISKRNKIGGKDFDIEIPRIGYAGVKHPDREVKNLDMME